MKKLFLLGLFLLCLPIVMAVDFNASIVSPIPGEQVNANGGLVTILNVSIDVDETAEIANITCEFWYRALDTANSTYILLVNITNTSELGGVNITGVNTSINFTYPNFEDSNVSQVYAKCYNISQDCNSSNEITSSAITFTMDNTAPGILSATPADSTTDADGDLTFTVNSYTNTSVKAWLYFVNNHPGFYRNYGLTEGTDLYSLAFTDISEGRYNWYIEVSDGFNTTVTATRELIVEEDPSSARKLAAAQQIAKTTPGIEQVGPRTFTIAKTSPLQRLSVFGDQLINTKWGPMAPIVWIIASILVVAGIFYYKRKK